MGKTSALPGQGLNRFRDHFTSAICAVECEAQSGRKDFATSFDSVHLGAVDVFRYHGQSLRYSQRSIQHIRDNPVDDFLVLLPINAPFELVQTGNRAIVEPGSFSLLSTQKPFEGYCNLPVHETYTELKLRIPGTLLRQKVPHVDQCCAIPVLAHEGVGSLMRPIIEQVLAESGSIGDTKARMYSAMLLNALGIALLDAPELSCVPVSARELSHARVRQRAQDFIERSLSNPLLDCALIADHCRVSLRHLHGSFEGEQTTVRTVIRELRLQRCRDDLLNTSLRHQSILQIAMKWGYRSSASFARAYHERFGRSPSEERQAFKVPVPG